MTISAGCRSDCQQTVNADVHGWRVLVDTFTTQALPIVREVGDRLGEATTLTNIGAVYNGLGDDRSQRTGLPQSVRR